MMDRFTKAVATLAESMIATSTAAVEMVAALAELLTPARKGVECVIEALQPYVEQYAEQQAAISWARSARPAWYAIYYRTKKKRTRKKYLNRIIREYRGSVGNGVLEV